MPRETLTSLKETIARRDADIAALHEQMANNAKQSDQMMSEISRLTQLVEALSKDRVWMEIVNRAHDAAHEARAESLYTSIDQVLDGTFRIDQEGK